MNRYDIEKIKRKAGTLGENVIRKLQRTPKKVLLLSELGILLGIGALGLAKAESESEAKENAYKVESKVEEANVAIVEMEDNIVDKQLGESRLFGKPFILKVKPTGYTYAEIYKTIDCVKELAKTIEMNYPILFDIEPLMATDTLRANCLLAEEFCNKLTANGFYVGLYGTDESMKKFEQEFSEVTKTHSIDLYDKLIAYQGEQPTYEGTFNMQQQDGKDIEFKYDLAAIIKDKKLNNPENYKEDQKYIVEPNDNLSRIAKSVSMKTTDLAEYNNIKDANNLKVGQEIIIPNQYQVETLQMDKDKESIDHEQMPSETTTRLVKGIDVSEHQGNIDWEQVQQNVDFAIVRLCDFIRMQPDGTCILDKKFYDNMKECERLNIPVGVYYYSHATTKEEAQKEAKFVAKSLKEYSLEYPVYMDIEAPEQNPLMDSNSQQMKEAVVAAMTELEGEGYFAGVYCNPQDNHAGRKNFIDSISQVANCWLVSNQTYNTEVGFPEFKEESYTVVTMPSSNIALYQYCQKGKVAGISGDVDLNYGDAGLAKVIEEKGFSKVKKN